MTSVCKVSTTQQGNGRKEIATNLRNRTKTIYQEKRTNRMKFSMFLIWQLCWTQWCYMNPLCQRELFNSLRQNAQGIQSSMKKWFLLNEANAVATRGNNISRSWLLFDVLIYKTL